MFYRCGGLSKKIYQVTILPNMKVVQYNPGDELPTDTHFHILYQGTIELSVFEEGKLQGTYKGHSGKAFDFKDMELLYDPTPFKNDVIQVKALTHVKLFQFSKESIRDIAHLRKSIWQTLMIENLTRIVVKQYDHRLATAILDPEYWHPFFLPLEEWEEPERHQAGSARALQNVIEHILASMHHSWSPPWPLQKYPISI